QSRQALGAGEGGVGQGQQGFDVGLVGGGELLGGDEIAHVNLLDESVGLLQHRLLSCDVALQHGLNYTGSIRGVKRKIVHRTMLTRLTESIACVCRPRPSHGFAATQRYAWETAVCSPLIAGS